jgi:hypothetical protein
MSEERTQVAKTKKPRGPVADRLKIKGDWKDAVKVSFRKKITKRAAK